MNTEAQELFDSLVKLDPSSLTPDNIAFLVARRTYLTTDQHRIFDEVLGLVDGEPKVVEETEEPAEKLEGKLAEVQEESTNEEEVEPVENTKLVEETEEKKPEVKKKK